MTEGLSETELTDYMLHLANLERAGERAELRVGPYSAMILIGVLQLASRHPGMSTTQLDQLSGLVDQLSGWFAGTPGEEIIKMGNDARYDA